MRTSARRIDDYRRARNCLAHNGGSVDDDEHRSPTHIEIDTTGVFWLRDDERGASGRIGSGLHDELSCRED